MALVPWLSLGGVSSRPSRADLPTLRTPPPLPLFPRLFSAVRDVQDQTPWSDVLGRESPKFLMARKTALPLGDVVQESLRTQRPFKLYGVARGRAPRLSRLPA